MAAVAHDIRKALLAKIHIAWKQLDMDEDAYRALLERVTGKRSAGDCSDAELQAVLDEFGRLGWKPRPRHSRRKSSGKAAPAQRYLPKLRALWLSGAALGCIDDSTDQAMNSFIERQTGLSDSRFLSRASDSSKAIEALKSWLGREGGVVWSDHPENPKRAVLEAQWRRLTASAEVKEIVKIEAYDALWLYCDQVVGRGGPNTYDTADWDRLIQALGGKIRQARVVE